MNSKDKDKSAYFKGVVSNYKNEARFQRLAHQLGISMSLMSDAHVRGMHHPQLGMPAATSKRNFGGGGLDTYSRSKRISGKVYVTDFDSELLGSSIPVWLGTAWHELGHVMWSPFDSGVIVTMALNLLEDARIETLLLLKYPKTRGALMATLEYLIEMQTAKPTAIRNEQNPEYMYAWVAGRGHLSKEIRATFRALSVHAKEIDEIFKQYLGMGSQLDTQVAVGLAAELAQLLGMTDQNHVCQGASTGDGIRDHKGEGEDAMSIDTDDIGEDGIGASGSVLTAEEAQDLKNAIAKARAELREELKEEHESDDTLQEEVTKLEKLLATGAGGLSSKTLSTQAGTPSGSARQLAQQVRRAAARFNDETGKGLVRRRDHGRLRPMRYEKYEDIDSAYDVWEPGLDQEMHVWLLMDTSGSMYGAPVADVLYGLEVGLEDVATVDVVLFNDSYIIPNIKNSGQRQIHTGATGGTDPSDALSYIHSRIPHSPAMNKLLVLYTDGGFNDSKSYAISGAFVADMKRQGVHVRLLGEDNGTQFTTLRNHIELTDKEWTMVSGIHAIPDVVIDWTKTILTRGV